MIYLKRSIMVCFIILLSLASMACGELRISASTGDIGRSSGYSESLDAEINDQIHEKTALAISSSSLSQSFSGSGDRAETFSATNTLGDHAEVGFDIDNSNSYSGSYTLSPENARYARATEALNVGFADSIYTFAKAVTRDGYEGAALSLSLKQGSLVGYSNSAYATKGRAEVAQKLKSATGEEILFSEGAGKTLDDLNWEFFVGEMPYPPSSDKIQNGKQSVSLNAAVPEGALIEDYSSVTTATDKIAQKKVTIGYSSAAGLGWNSNAFNKEGDRTFSEIQVQNGQISKLSLTTTASSAYTDSILKAGSANGDYVYSDGESYNSEGDGAWAFIEASGAASLKTLNLNSHASLKGVKTLGKAGSTSGSDLVGVGTAFNKEGDIAQTYVVVSDGSICGWSSDNQATLGSASNQLMSFSGASGTLVDVGSHAENKAPADERDLLVEHGAADFELQAKSLKSTKIKSTATTTDVLITPTLPTGIKTAIMLEPYKTAFVEVGGATDLGTTVFPDLVEKGYATLRYTDSGATFSKYQNLGKYNVVIADGHGDSDGIDLSTGPGYISAKQLKYKAASKNSLVVLTMCKGFGGYPTKSALATAFGSAYLAGGFTDSVGTLWADDYLSYLFDSLKNGDTASVANDYALAEATAKYGSGPYYLPLEFYGKDDFVL